MKNPWLKEELAAFVNECSVRGKSKPITFKLPRYAELFTAIDKASVHKSDINYGTLIEIGYERGLRTYRPVINFFTLRGLLPPLSDSGWADIRTMCATRRRLEGMHSEWYYGIMKAFYDHMAKVRDRYRRFGWDDRGVRPRPKTIHSYIDAAARFLKSCPQTSEKEIQTISDDSLNSFLYANPGYRDSLRGFLRYLNQAYRPFRKLKIPTVKNGVRADAHMPDEQQKRLFADLKSRGRKQPQSALICALLVIYAQLPKKIAELKLSQFENDPENGWTAHFGRSPLTLDPFVARIFDNYLHTRAPSNIFEQGWENDYLFPGMTRGTHLDETSIKWHLDQFGIKTTQGFSTALLNIYQNGLMRPDIVSATLGITLITAMKYYNHIGPRQIAESAIDAENRRHADLSLRT